MVPYNTYMLGVRFVEFGRDLFYVLNVQPERTHSRSRVVACFPCNGVYVRKHKKRMYVHMYVRMYIQREKERCPQFLADLRTLDRA